MSKKIKDENGTTYVEKKPFYKKKWFIVIAAIVVIGAIGSSLGGDKDGGSKPAETQQTASEAPAEAPAKEEEAPKEYTAVTADQMIQDLQDNALKAQETYKDKYLEISGKLSNVDSSGKYISIDGVNGDFNLVTIQCYIKSDEQKSIVAELSRDQNVTIKGKVTRVGEVMGYSLDIDEIIAQ